MAHCAKTCDSGKPRDQMEETQSIICEDRMGRIETEDFQKKSRIRAKSWRANTSYMEEGARRERAGKQSN